MTPQIGVMKMPKWNKTSELKPKEEKQYLCCDTYDGEACFKVLWWSNNLYAINGLEFSARKGECGFCRLDPDWGYLESFCDYWQEIEWSGEDDE